MITRSTRKIRWPTSGVLWIDRLWSEHGEWVWLELNRLPLAFERFYWRSRSSRKQILTGRSTSLLNEISVASNWQTMYGYRSSVKNSVRASSAIDIFHTLLFQCHISLENSSDKNTRLLAGRVGMLTEINRKTPRIYTCLPLSTSRSLPSYRTSEKSQRTLIFRTLLDFWTRQENQWRPDTQHVESITDKRRELI